MNEGVWLLQNTLGRRRKILGCVVDIGVVGDICFVVVSVVDIGVVGDIWIVVSIVDIGVVGDIWIVVVSVVDIGVVGDIWIVVLACSSCFGGNGAIRSVQGILLVGFVVSIVAQRGSSLQSRSFQCTHRWRT